MEKIGKFLEKWFAPVSIVFFTGGILPVILSGGASEGEEGDGGSTDSSAIKLLFLVIYLITWSLMILRWKKTIVILKKDQFIPLLLGFVLLTYLWSVYPSLTLSRSIALIGTSSFGIYLASRYTLKEQIIVLARGFGLALVISLIFVVVLRKYGIMGGVHSGTWRGIYVHKNVSGKMMVMSAVIFLLRYMQDDFKTLKFKQQIPVYLGMAFSVLMILMSASSSSILNLVFVVGLLIVAHTWRLPVNSMTSCVTGTVFFLSCFQVWFSENSEKAFNSIGKDSNLTGRTDMWPVIIEYILRNPWLGYGYGVFWSSDYVYDVWSAIGWTAPNSHNGILDMLLGVGFVGVGIFVIGVFNVLLKAVILVRYSHTSETFWPLLFMFFLLLSNLTETSLMLQNDVYWAFYVAVAYCF